MTRIARPAFGTFLFFAVAFALCVYFTFAAVQGDFGLFQRAQIDAESRVLAAQLAEVRADLLDEQARRVLGMVRSDEIVIR